MTNADIEGGYLVHDDWEKLATVCARLEIPEPPQGFVRLCTLILSERPDFVAEALAVGLIEKA